MKRIMIFAIWSLLLTVCVCAADDQAALQAPKLKDPTLTDPTFRDSYSLGYEFGASLKMREVGIDADVLLGAVREALEGKKPALTPEEMKETLSLMKKKVMVTQDLRFREYAEKNRKESIAFMEANKSAEGVKTLQSGLQYKVLSEGSGPSPALSDFVKLSYVGTLTDGTVFDNSHGPEGPLVARADNLLKGWSEAVQLMKAGSKWRLFVPPWLGYGERIFRGIPPNSVLIYDLDLLSIGEVPLPPKSKPRPAEGESPSLLNGKEDLK